MEIKGKVHCMFEQWRDVKGFEGVYQVSNLGRVRSVSHYVNIRNNNKRLVIGRILKQWKTCNGYMQVKTSKKYGSKHLNVHRLVAIAFIDNPENLSIVNHKDENKSNNLVTNLEWCSKSYNSLYGHTQEKLRHHKVKAVRMLDKNNNKLLAVFDSMITAEEQKGVSASQISGVCRGIRKTAGGFKWEYVL